MTSTVSLTDAAALRAMAHPLRLGILGSLRVDGPATSAMLARRLGTDTGQTSHHLRLLARHGFVADAPEHGRGARGRERWWKAVHRVTRWTDTEDLPPDAVQALEGAIGQVFQSLVTTYRAQVAAGEWSPDWRAAAGSDDFVVRTTPAGLGALRDDLRRVIEAHRPHDDDGDAETVVVVLQAHPRRAAR